MRIKIKIRGFDDDFESNKFPFLGLFICLLLVGIAFMGGGTITNLLSQQIKNVDYQEVMQYPQYQHMSLDEVIDKFHYDESILRATSITLFSLGVFVFLVIFGLFIGLRFKKEHFVNNVI